MVVLACPTFDLSAPHAFDRDDLWVWRLCAKLLNQALTRALDWSSQLKHLVSMGPTILSWIIFIGVVSGMRKNAFLMPLLVKR